MDKESEEIVRVELMRCIGWFFLSFILMIFLTGYLRVIHPSATAKKSEKGKREPRFRERTGGTGDRGHSTMDGRAKKTKNEASDSERFGPEPCAPSGERRTIGTGLSTLSCKFFPVSPPIVSRGFGV